MAIFFLCNCGIPKDKIKVEGRLYTQEGGNLHGVANENFVAEIRCSEDKEALVMSSLGEGIDRIQNFTTDGNGRYEFLKTFSRQNGFCKIQLKHAPGGYFYSYFQFQKYGEFGNIAGKKMRHDIRVIESFEVDDLLIEGVYKASWPPVKDAAFYVITLHLGEIIAAGQIVYIDLKDKTYQKLTTKENQVQIDLNRYLPGAGAPVYDIFTVPGNPERFRACAKNRELSGFRVDIAAAIDKKTSRLNFLKVNKGYEQDVRYFFSSVKSKNESLGGFIACVNEK